MLINTPISLGELVDKISILIIKQQNITDETKLDHVKKELDFLQKTLMNYVQQEEIKNYLENLININSKLWNIEENKRKAEKEKKFDSAFIQLSRDVYKSNDERAKIKLEINNHTGSKIKEIKEYTSY